MLAAPLVVVWKSNNEKKPFSPSFSSVKEVIGILTYNPNIPLNNILTISTHSFIMLQKWLQLRAVTLLTGCIFSPSSLSPAVLMRLFLVFHRSTIIYRSVRFIYHILFNSIKQHNVDKWKQGRKTGQGENAAVSWGCYKELHILPSGFQFH